MGCPHGYRHPKEEINTPMDVALQWGATTITLPGPVDLGTVISAGAVGFTKAKDRRKKMKGNRGLQDAMTAAGGGC